MSDGTGPCVCGDAPEDHSDTGECQVEGCICGCYEEDEEED